MLARDAVARSPDAFAAAGALRAASEALRAALDAEEIAEGGDGAAHAAWRQAHTRMVSAAEAVHAEYGPLSRLRKLVVLWTDPYAPDATGAAVLDALEAACGDAPACRPLRAAIAQVRATGRAVDAAEAARAEAISNRVARTRDWRAAAEALLAVAPLADSGTLAALSAVAAPDPALDWFEE